MVLNVDQAKILAMFVLGGGSFFVGMIPGYLNHHHQQRHQLLITFLLCFGAGVLFATSIVHILSEVQQSLPETGAIFFCVGFFLVYIVDVIVHTVCAESSNSPTHRGVNHNQTQHDHSNEAVAGGSRNYGSREDERVSLLGPRSENSGNVIGQNQNIQCPNSNRTGKLGLLSALSLHSFLEGLAIGIQDTSSKVLILITAVACHKYVVGFCLGLEVNSSSNRTTSNVRLLFVSMLIFAFGSVCGIGIGMALVDFKEVWSSSTIPILQAVAGGTLLYVTMCEVLPREKAKYHQRSRSAIVLQLIAVILGFVLMTLMNSFLAD